MNRNVRRVSYVFLCAVPFLVFGTAAARPLRVAGLHPVIGGILFVLIAAAASIVGTRKIVAGDGGRRRLALAGTLFILPWAMIALLWVGIGPPFAATPAENYMRFFLLLTNSIVVSGAFLVLKEELGDAGERFYSTLGLAASIPAGIGYMGCMSLICASYVVKLRDGQAPDMGMLSDVFDVFEFVACVTTYLATACFAAALGHLRWLGRGAIRGYVIASLVMLGLIAIRGVSYPEISSSASPWYTHATWIAGIPAIPWIMPCLLGVVLLKRAGDEAH